LSALLKIEALNPAPAREPQTDIVDTWIRLGDLKPAPARDPQDGTGGGMGLVPKTLGRLRGFHKEHDVYIEALRDYLEKRGYRPSVSP
jgi:hypothetical protein